MSEQKTNPEADIMNPDVHLSRLLTVETQKTWFAGFVENLKDILRPQKLPPLEVTSKPVAVRSIWGFTGGQESRAGLTSFLVHATVIVLLFTLGTNKAVQDKVREAVTLIAPDISPYVPDAKPQPKQMGGGGGGGDNSPMPVSKGRLPKPSPKQFVPPAAVVHNDNPKLVMEPTIVAPPDLQLPNVNMAVWGDPFGKGTLPSSNGPGSGGGMGSGKGGGVGPGEGGGYGPG
ncbi:MAG: energy transducer TonB, partial [Bryobacteraceae bacterium]